MKAGTAAALKADYERKAVAACIPYLQAFHGTVDPAELHDASHISPTPIGRGQRLAESENAAGLTYTGFSPRGELFFLRKSPIGRPLRLRLINASDRQAIDGLCCKICEGGALSLRRRRFRLHGKAKLDQDRPKTGLPASPP